MAGARVVADTNVFIEYLRAAKKEKTWLQQLPNDTELFISAVTRYELLMGATDDRKKMDVELLTGSLPALPFSKTVADKAAAIYHELRLKNKMIEFRDIFIAATALANNLPLLTTNRKDFSRIEGLIFHEL